jgi:anti-sigma factor RsiW
MLRCNSAEALIVREADGVLMPLERDLLERHTEGCAACRARREANLAVKAVLSERVDADVHPAFAVQVAARVADAGHVDWLAGIDWRRRTEWMLPVAAALALLVVLVGNTAPASSSDVSTAAVSAETATTAADELTGGVAGLSQDPTSEELLSAMLGAPVGTAGETSDGR